MAHPMSALQGQNPAKVAPMQTSFRITSEGTSTPSTTCTESMRDVSVSDSSNGVWPSIRSHQSLTNNWWYQEWRHYHFSPILIRNGATELCWYRGEWHTTTYQDLPNGRRNFFPYERAPPQPPQVDNVQIGGFGSPDLPMPDRVKNSLKDIIPTSSVPKTCQRIAFPRWSQSTNISELPTKQLDLLLQMNLPEAALLKHQRDLENDAVLLRQCQRNFGDVLFSIQSFDFAIEAKSDSLRVIRGDMMQAFEDAGFYGSWLFSKYNAWRLQSLVQMWPHYGPIMPTSWDVLSPTRLEKLHRRKEALARARGISEGTSRSPSSLRRRRNHSSIPGHSPPEVSYRSLYSSVRLFESYRCAESRVSGFRRQNAVHSSLHIFEKFSARHLSPSPEAFGYRPPISRPSNVLAGPRVPIEVAEGLTGYTKPLSYSFEEGPFPRSRRDSLLKPKPLSPATLAKFGFRPVTFKPLSFRKRLLDTKKLHLTFNPLIKPRSLLTEGLNPKIPSKGKPRITCGLRRVRRIADLRGESTLSIQDTSVSGRIAPFSAHDHHQIRAIIGRSDDNFDEGFDSGTSARQESHTPKQKYRVDLRNPALAARSSHPLVLWDSHYFSRRHGDEQDHRKQLGIRSSELNQARILSVHRPASPTSPASFLSPVITRTAYVPGHGAAYDSRRFINGWAPSLSIPFSDRYRSVEDREYDTVTTLRTDIAVEPERTVDLEAQMVQEPAPLLTKVMNVAKATARFLIGK